MNLSGTVPENGTHYNYMPYSAGKIVDPYIFVDPGHLLCPNTGIKENLSETSFKNEVRSGMHQIGMQISTRHVMMVEPVAPDSRVAHLIKEEKER